MRLNFHVLAVVLVCLLPGFAGASFDATDDMGNRVSLDKKPASIVSLAPHITEMLFSLGAGDRIVATVRHSDFPAAAGDIPRLGDAFSLSVEAVVALSPDLIIAWTTGGNGRTLQQLRDLGFPVYLNEAASLDAIATSLERIGALVGEAQKGQVLAEEFRASLSGIRRQYASAGQQTVFFQIADTQLYTVNGRHLIGQAIEACNAVNIYAHLSIPVPLVSLESLVDKNPGIIVVAAPHDGFVSTWQSTWQRLGWADRVRPIDASLITRPSLRMLKGIKSLCKTVHDA